MDSLLQWQFILNANKSSNDLTLHHDVIKLSLLEVIVLIESYIKIILLLIKHQVCDLHVS